MIKHTRGERVFNMFNLIFLTLLSICAFYPMYYVLMASLSDSGKLMSHSGLLLYPDGFSLQGYKVIIDNTNIWTGYGNTLFIVIIGTILSLAVTSMAAYPLSRRSFTLRNFFMLLITFTMMFSGGLIPRFLVVKDVGLYDSIWSLILPVLVNTTNLIIMRTAFAAVPDSLEESAKIDGANDLITYARIILPLTKATLAVLALYYGVSYWNSWFTASIYLRSRDKFPLQLILREILIANDNVNTDNELMAESIKYAAIIVSTVPILCAYPFLQRYFVKGVMIGAVKG
ncbi:MAG: carbohydrate ABC transporter permease [Lachnospirales bacterium]